jgi:hypothetical protein
MNSRFTIGLVAAVSLATPALLSAQGVSTEVTFKIPVNLTQLGPDVQKVKVSCSLLSDAIVATTSGATALYGGGFEVAKAAELPATGGQVVTTALLVYTLTGLDNPVGKNANLSCILVGWSPTEKTWIVFDPNATNASFRTTTEVPVLKSSFVW